MIDVLLPMTLVASIVFTAGFCGGFLIRDTISRRRRREAMYWRGYGSFSR